MNVLIDDGQNMISTRMPAVEVSATNVYDSCNENYLHLLIVQHTIFTFEVHFFDLYTQRV